MRNPIRALMLGVLAWLIAIPAVQAQTGPAATAAPQTGYAVKRPMVAAACPTCPWGAVADVLDKIMEPRGYDLQICYYCSGVPNPRYVAKAMRPPPPRPDRPWLPKALDAPLDFGVTNVHRLLWAYAGLNDYKGEAMPNLRAIGLIEHPMYIGIAVRAESFITDLAQIAERKLPVRMIAHGDPMVTAILAHYGITQEKLESWGGKMMRDDPENRNDFDVIVQNQLYLANTPEAGVWYEISQHNRLRFLPMPEDLRQKLIRDFDMRPAVLPADFVRGLTKPVPTVARSGQVVYARADAPDDFVYALARGMDERSDLFAWTVMPLSYNPRTAPHALGVPLHPAAARYYRERGYIP